MFEKLFLFIIAIYVLASQFFIKNFVKFENIFDQKKQKNQFLRRDQAFRLIRIINKLAKLLNIKSCFTKTLAYRKALNLALCQSTIYVGVKHEGESIASHCWLESNGYKTEDHRNQKDFKIIKKIKC